MGGPTHPTGPALTQDEVQLGVSLEGAQVLVEENVTEGHSPLNGLDSVVAHIAVGMAEAPWEAP